LTQVGCSKHIGELSFCGLLVQLEGDSSVSMDESFEEAPGADPEIHY
jgi:hypothetical protein